MNKYFYVSLIVVILIAAWYIRHDECQNDELDLVADNLYISNWRTSVDEMVLKKYGIKTILCLNERKKTDEDLKMYERLGIRHIAFNIRDVPRAPIKLVFPTCYRLIKSNNDPMLIHCTSGVSRSAAVMTMYLMISRGLSFDDAYRVLKSKRIIANINPGFQAQLRALNRSAFVSNPNMRTIASIASN